MNERDRERLSALMDNEAGDLELRQVLKAVGSEPELLQTWKRYHLARAVLRRDAGDWAGVDLRASLTDRLDAESTAGARGRWPARLGGIRQWAAGVAVAASVAVVTVLGWQVMHVPAVTEAMPRVIASSPFAPAAASAQTGPQTVALDPMVMVREDGEELLVESSPSSAAQDRLNNYLARHARAAGSLGSARGVATYARVVSIEGEQGP